MTLSSQLNWSKSRPLRSLFSTPRFVLCENCENPETVIKVLEKKGIIKSSCKACGHNYQLDMRHKLTTFIVKVRSQGQAVNDTFQAKLKLMNFEPSCTTYM